MAREVEQKLAELNRQVIKRRPPRLKRAADHSIEEKLLRNGGETGIVIIGVCDRCHVGGRTEVGRGLINFEARSAVAALPRTSARRSQPWGRGHNPCAQNQIR